MQIIIYIYFKTYYNILSSLFLNKIINESFWIFENKSFNKILQNIKILKYYTIIKTLLIFFFLNKSN